MGIARRFVFPILRLVVFAAIAAALIKLAFFADPTGSTSAAVPTGQITDPLVTVATGTITNDVVLTGSVETDAAVPVLATVSGAVTKVSATTGDRVDGGTVLATVKETVQPSSPTGTPYIRYVTLKAGASGTLSAFPLLVGQQVAVGQIVGQVAPPTFSVRATLQPTQQYRLLNKPTEAKVTVTGGPAPFTCGNLAITTPLAGAGAADTSGSGASGISGGAAGTGMGAASGTSSGGTTVTCAVPSDVTVFPGLAAKMTIGGGVADNALVVPTTAVEGGSGTGVVYLPSTSGGSPEKKPVTLGLTDGTQVQITGGLAAGDQILQYVPGACSATPQGGGMSGGVVSGGMISGPVGGFGAGSTGC